MALDMPKVARGRVSGHIEDGKAVNPAAAVAGVISTPSGGGARVLGVRLRQQ